MRCPFLREAALGREGLASGADTQLPWVLGRVAREPCSPVDEQHGLPWAASRLSPPSRRNRLPQTGASAPVVFRGLLMSATGCLAQTQTLPIVLTNSHHGLSVPFPSGAPRRQQMRQMMATLSKQLLETAFFGLVINKCIKTTTEVMSKWIWIHVQLIHNNQIAPVLGIQTFRYVLCKWGVLFFFKGEILNFCGVF